MKSDRKALVKWFSKLRGQQSTAKIYKDKCGYDEEYDSISRFGSKLIQSKELEDLQEKYTSTCILFTYKQVLTITSNFSSKKLIGEGGNSFVYKGDLPNGKQLAIKILKPCLNILKEFQLETEVITSLDHKNIVSIFGLCFENHLMMLYEYLPRGSLEDNLYGNNITKFGWVERFKVALGVAKALDYLHNVYEPKVIHRDVKSSNVLLGNDFEPKLSDFGFATSQDAIVSNGVISGTFGYLAPEYFTNGKVTEKIDVYAYGVVLLELLTGRKPICEDQKSLVLWAKPILESGKFEKLLDPRLETKNYKNLIEKLWLAAMLCIKRLPQDRPQMGLVVKILQGEEEAIVWGKHQLKGSQDESTYLESYMKLALFDFEDEVDSDSSLESSIMSVD